MKVKNIAMQMLGEKGVQRAVYCKKLLCLVKSALNGNRNRIDVSGAGKYRLYHIKGKNVFFGYYDLKACNSSGKKLIAHVVDKSANPVVDAAKIVWFDCEGTDTRPHMVGETKAWCWQQGARLRWHPVEKDTILFNDFVDHQYVLRKVNINSGLSEIIGCAVYDIDGEMKYGVTLNFSRLQRLRPGYGYLNISDSTEGEKAPNDDSAFLVDMQSGKKNLLYSLSQLAKDVDDDGSHYINHLSIAPDGQHFIFFHLWTFGAKWKRRLYVSDMMGTNLKRLTDDIVVSHYCWMDNENLLITTTAGAYLCVNINSGKRQQVEEKHLIRDGHPNKFRDGFVSDTYPLDNQLQKVFCCRLDGTGYREIANVFSYPLKFGEHRCDLHPRVETNQRITIDTTAIGGVRSIMSIEVE